MSATLYALVVLQGTALNSSPGYTTAAECLAVYKEAPPLLASRQDPGPQQHGRRSLNFPGGGFRRVYGINSEDECKRYIDAFRDGVPTACRQLAMPSGCSAACRLLQCRNASKTPKPDLPRKLEPAPKETPKVPEHNSSLSGQKFKPRHVPGILSSRAKVRRHGCAGSPHVWP